VSAKKAARTDPRSEDTAADNRQIQENGCSAERLKGDVNHRFETRSPRRHGDVDLPRDLELRPLWP
jgi:hypothetical protein